MVGQKEVFETKGDEFDCALIAGCRNKTIHSVGNVGKIAWIDHGNHPYTGIFKGGDTGYVRMSSAAPVDEKTPNMKPGMGVKFLRDGADSANFVAMFGVDGQNDLNFFQNDWSNHIPSVKSKALVPLALRFKTQTDYIQTVGLSDMASITQEGVTEDPIFPWKLRFEPSGDFEFPETTYDVPFEQYLQTIAAGSTLFNIYAWDQPEELGGTESLIASMVTASTMVTSKWGDEHMFFRHQRMDDDLKIRPEWEPYTPIFKVFGEDDGYLPDIAAKVVSACPFAYLFQ